MFEFLLVRCPYVGDNYNCTTTLKPREIKALLPTALHDAYLSRSVKQAEGAMANTFHCKTPDCPGWYELDENHNVRIFTCEVCQKENCIKHQVCHMNISCEDYENRLVQNENDLKTESAVSKLIATGKAMRCPNCKIILEKVVGCDAVRCSVCRTALCWATKGLRWGPRGVGDNSGGCKCMAPHRCSKTCKGCSSFHN